MNGKAPSRVIIVLGWNENRKMLKGPDRRSKPNNVDK